MFVKNLNHDRNIFNIYTCALSPSLALIPERSGEGSPPLTFQEEVLSRARRIHFMGFKPKDSIHLSCAIEAGSSIFFTTDTGILKKADLIADLALINPVDYEFNKP